MDIQFPDFSGSLFTYYKEGVKMYSLDLHNAVKMSYKKMFFSFSECEFRLMRSFSCHTDCTNRGITVPPTSKLYLFMGMGPKNIPMGQTFILATCTTPP